MFRRLIDWILARLFEGYKGKDWDQ